MTDFDARAKTWDADPVKHERARAVAEAIRAAVPLGGSALEYGCGTGLLSFLLQPYLSSITLVDSSEGMLAELTGKIAASGFTNMVPFRSDLTEGPLPSERFALIYSLMTLHHVPDTGRILRRFFEFLDCPGTLCIADLDAEDGSFHGPDFDGHKGFDREALRKMAEGAGFRDMAFTTAFVMPREIEGSVRHYPLFLMTARKCP